MVRHLSVARVAEGLGVSWNTANDAVLAEGERVLIDVPGRLHGEGGSVERTARVTSADGCTRATPAALGIEPS